MTMATELQLNNIHAIFKFGNEFKLFDGIQRAELYYSDRKHDLINNTIVKSTSEEIKREFQKISLEGPQSSYKVVLNYYELGELIELGESPEDLPLVMFLEFSNVSEFKFKNLKTSIKVTTESFEEKKSYDEKFDSVKASLEYGHCYQINLTTPSTYSFDSSVEELCHKFFNYSALSEFAHYINLPVLKKSILSNSPECLFVKEGNRLLTRPIKGTVTSEEGIEHLESSVKDESELNIITDLLRNDLSRIGRNFSKVNSEKSFLKVPGLVHQYSEIEVELEGSETLYDIMWAMFPGGSITGAPKKRVIKLIKEIEAYDRGVYTGSTILFFNNEVKASINIRTAEICHKSKKLRYGAGGGITLLSDRDSEYREMQIKKSSFINILS